MSASGLPGHTRALLESLVPVVLPSPPAAAAAELAARAGVSLSAAPKHLRAGLIAGALAYDLGAIAYPRVLPLPAHRLPIEQRRRYFQAWWHSPLMPQRELAKAFKGFLALAHFEHERTRAALDYDPTGWTEKVRARRLATYSDAITAHERAITAPDPLPVGVFSSRRAALVERAS